MKFDGDKLRAAMDSSGLKVVQIIERSGVGKTALYDYINGKYDPGSDTLAALATTLDRPIGDFFSDDRSTHRTKSAS